MLAAPPLLELLDDELLLDELLDDELELFEEELPVELPSPPQATSVHVDKSVGIHILLNIVPPSWLLCSVQMCLVHKNFCFLAALAVPVARNNPLVFLFRDSL